MCAMKLFNTVALEINARCNRSCTFCPVAYNTRPDERMPAHLLRKALDELGALRYHGRIELYIYNEPAREMEYLLDVLRAGRHTVPRGCFMVATNGDYLRGPGNIMAMFDAGLNQLLINCYSPGLYAKRLPWLAALPGIVHRTNDVYVNVGPHRRVVHMLDKSEPATFGTGVFRLINRAGNIPAFLPATSAPVERMCVKPFRLLNVNWQGEALLCCNDYHGQLHIGNLADYTLEQLWNSPVLNTYRKHLLNKDRTLPLCSKCDCHAGAYPSNVEQPAVNARFLSVAAIRNRFKELP